MDIVSANIDEVIAHTLPEAIAQGLQQACIIVADAAKEKCPVDDGQLRQSITFQVDKKKLEGVIGSNVEYAPYVEVGTGIFSTKGNGRKTPWRYKDAKGDWHTTSGMKAQPFLEPAAEENKQEIVDCFEGLL